MESPTDPPSALAGAERARAAIEGTGIGYTKTAHGRVASLAEAAAARGLEPDQVLKTIVVRRGEDDFLLVLVPGGRTISWPKLRAHLGVSRLSMPSAAGAFAATGYERGTITPFGAVPSWPVIADAAIPTGDVSIGGGAHGTAFTVDSADLLQVLQARVADVTDAET
jgi:Cys-tRNA(Pro)/Cys-tRNA(Cys) deacylase